MSQSPERISPESQVQPVAEIPAPGKITSTSQDQYRAKAESLRRYSVGKRSRDPEEPVGVSISEAVEDLVARRDLSASSLMAYRSAMLWYLRDLQDQSEPNRRAYAMLLEMRAQEDAKPGRTKKKAIPEADYNELINELSEMATTSTWALRAQAWVQATLASGARPVEWLDASFADADKTKLAIVTAKHHLEPPRFMTAAGSDAAGDQPPGNRTTADPIQYEEAGQGSGEEEGEADTDQESPARVAGDRRVVPLAPGMDRLATEMHLAYFNHVVPTDLPLGKRLDGFRKYHDQCRWVLRNACQRLWKGKKNYTLYTFRSQFQANQRARLGAKGAAGLMGHSTEMSTSTAHYGKANQAFARFKAEKAAAGGQTEAAAEQGAEVQGGNGPSHTP